MFNFKAILQGILIILRPSFVFLKLYLALVSKASRDKYIESANSQQNHIWTVKLIVRRSDKFKVWSPVGTIEKP